MDNIILNRYNNYYDLYNKYIVITPINNDYISIYTNDIYFNDNIIILDNIVILDADKYLFIQIFSNYNGYNIDYIDK